MDKSTEYIVIYSLTGLYVRGSQWRRVIMALGLKPPPPNKNTIEPNRGVARGNRRNVPPIPGKLEY